MFSGTTEASHARAVATHSPWHSPIMQAPRVRAMQGTLDIDDEEYSMAISDLYELLSIFPHILNGHGFLIRDYIRDYTELQEGLLCPRSLGKPTIDSSSYVF